jgi:hypothetical protein
VRLSVRSIYVVMACVVALTLVGSVTASGTAPAGDATAARTPCRGPADLENFLSLSGGRRISVRRVSCGVAQQVVKRFAGRCIGAYTSQGSCRLKARKRWRCTSRLVGSLEAGAPSSVICKAGRGQVRFRVEISLPAHDSSTPVAASSAGPPKPNAEGPGAPYNESLRCIDASGPARVVEPRPQGLNDTFEIRTYGRVPLRFGAAVQAKLVSRRVATRLLAGLGARPRGYPGRVPVFLTSGESEGVTSYICDGAETDDGVVVAVDDGLETTSQMVAHELAHIYSRGIRVSPNYPWFEDPVAEWSTWKAGWYTPLPQVRDITLQYPEKPLDTINKADVLYRYGMWRFVQFLDDQGMIVAGNDSWPLIRGVVAGSPAHTPTLDRLLGGFGTSIGREAAAFWGEHLKQKPKHPPRLVPAHGVNSRELTVAPGQGTLLASTCGLCTSLDDFFLSKSVKRVEFEFEPADNSYFWGLVAPNESRRFQFGESVSFCVGEPVGDDLKWPGHFPVTFTNGLLNHTSTLKGDIKIYAQTNADQCADPEKRGCRILREAGARALLGPDPPRVGGFRGHEGVNDAGQRRSSCTYTGAQGLGILDIDRWRSSKQLRRWIRRKDDTVGWETVKLGDAAIQFENATCCHTVVQVAVGRDRLTVQVNRDGGGSTSQALRLAREAIELL